MRDVAFTLFKLSPTFFIASCFLVGLGPTLRATVWLAALGYGGFILGRAALPHLRARFPRWFAPEPFQMHTLYRPDERHDGRDLESRLHRDLLASSDEDLLADEDDGETSFLPGIAPPQETASALPAADETAGDAPFLPGVEWLDGQRPRS